MCVCLSLLQGDQQYGAQGGGEDHRSRVRRQDHRYQRREGGVVPGGADQKGHLQGNTDTAHVRRPPQHQ